MWLAPRNRDLWEKLEGERKGLFKRTITHYTTLDFVFKRTIHGLCNHKTNLIARLVLPQGQLKYIAELVFFRASTNTEKITALNLNLSIQWQLMFN